MKRLLWMGTGLAVLLLAARTPLSASPILTLDPPSGAVNGLPGTTVGWGFNITNDTSSFLVVTSLTASGFSLGIGSLTDYIAALNFYVVAPNSSLPVAFSSATTQGTAAYAINAGATAGASDSGLFAITYDLLVNDPNGGGGSDPNDQFGLAFADVSASVTVTDVPEPGALFMLLTGVGLLLVAARRRLLLSA